MRRLLEELLSNPDLVYYDKLQNQMYHASLSTVMQSFELWVYDEIGCISHGFIGKIRLKELEEAGRIEFIGEL
jgi:hypothetical protein